MFRTIIQLQKSICRNKNLAKWQHCVLSHTLIVVPLLWLIVLIGPRSYTRARIMIKRSNRLTIDFSALLEFLTTQEAFPPPLPLLGQRKSTHEARYDRMFAWVNYSTSDQNRRLQQRRQVRREQRSYACGSWSVCVTNEQLMPVSFVFLCRSVPATWSQSINWKNSVPVLLNDFSECTVAVCLKKYFICTFLFEPYFWLSATSLYEDGFWFLPFNVKLFLSKVFVFIGSKSLKT